MAKAPPPTYAPHWWRRALSDGQHCERKRRERYFEEYLEEAQVVLESAGLLPVRLQGPFRVIYKRGFRLGYDNALRARQADKAFLPRRVKHAKLAK